MFKDIVTLEVFRMLAEEIAKDREKELGKQCSVATCPLRAASCADAPLNVVPFKPRRPTATSL